MCSMKVKEAALLSSWVGGMPPPPQKIVKVLPLVPVNVTSFAIGLCGCDLGKDLGGDHPGLGWAINPVTGLLVGGRRGRFETHR